MSAPHPLGPLEPLAKFDQWIVVKLVPLPTGKTDKLPVDYRSGEVTLKGTDGAHNPDTWTTYEAATIMASHYGPGHTVGFVLTAADPWFVVDIDGALDAQTGQWSDLALRIVQALPNTCVEVSQSGRGLHLWGQGAVPPHSMKRTDLHAELYTERRFIAIGSGAVGDMSQPCPTIAAFAAEYFPPRERAGDVPDEGPCAEWSGPADDDELIALAMRSRSAASVFGKKATFADLYTGDAAALARAFPHATDVYDRSGADAALAQHLAYWSGKHVARIERIMRRSGLVRDKWDAHPSYLVELTITNACSMQREVYRAPTALPTVQASLREMTAAQVTANWVALTRALPRDAREQVIDLVSALTAIRPLALRQTLKAADDAAAIEARQAKVREAAGNRRLIERRPGDLTAQAREVEADIVATAGPGSYVSFAGVVCQVTVKALPYTHMADGPGDEPPSVPQIEPLDKVAMIRHVESVAQFFDVQTTGKQKLVDVPERLLDVLIGKKEHAAPIVNGLVTHPVVRHDGAILATNGLDAASGLFLSSCTVADALPLTQAAAAAAVHRLRATFLEGFEFATPLDADVALAGLFTGVQRRLLQGAPGLAVLASTQSSGKTTLARRIHIMLTGRDMPVSTFPLGDESEVGKRLLSLLLRSPAMVCFDNIQDGFTFASGVLAAAMTSGTFEQRVLGISRDASAPTNVLFVLTGNNLSLGNDEVTRWLVSRLAPRSARPEERKFLHADVLAHGLGIRAQVLRDVVGIVSGYMLAGAPLALSGSRFPTWDRMVRQPLVWAGALDVAAVFRANSEESEPARAFKALVWSLHELFKGQEFSASAVAMHAATVAPLPAQAPAREALLWALDALKVKAADSAKSVTRVLAAHLGKVADVDGAELKITKRTDGHRKVDVFRVVPAGFAGF